MSDASVTVVGNVASDIHAHRTKNGDWVASFRLACQRRYFDRRSRRWVDEPPSFYRVVCWRALAENVKNCVTKGEPIVIQGRMKLKDWNDDQGNRRTDAEIDAWSVSYDLVRGTAVFTRTRRQADPEDEDNALDNIRTEQRARAGDEVIVDPETGEMFNVSQLHDGRSHEGDGPEPEEDGSAPEKPAPLDGAQHPQGEEELSEASGKAEKGKSAQRSKLVASG